MDGRLQREMLIDQKVEARLNKLPSYVRDWYYNMKASRKTAATREQYIRNITSFLHFINPNVMMIRPQDITQSDVTNYFLSIQTTVKNGEMCYTSDSYQYATWCCLNNFFEFLIASDLISKNYIKMIAKPKNRDLERINEHRVLLDENDFKAILSAVKNEPDNFIEKRDYAMILLFMNTGMRRTAMSNIMLDDVDFKEHKLTVVDKGCKRHEYVLSNVVLDSINEWLKIRKDNNPSLFISIKGSPISPDTIAENVYKYTRKALGKPLSPHKLRAGYCSILYNKTGDIEFVRRAVGHSNATTTQRYIVTAGAEKKRASDIMGSLLT